MKHKAIVIGAINAGKTTLINALMDKKQVANKTQTLNYYDWIVDTPGEYTENPLHYKNIMATSFQMTHVIFVQSAVTSKNIFPPGFASGIPKLPIGVITKSEMAAADIEQSIDILKRVMISGPVVITSAITGDGLQFIKPLIECKTAEAMQAYVAETDHPQLRYIAK